LTALVTGAFREGLAASFYSLLQPNVLSAFGRTLFVCILVTALHAVFGMVVAWVLVRHEFPGKRLLDSLIDLPFAISPVVVGYMLLLLFGRRGLLAPILSAWDIQVAFALPGVILATLFVTFPFMVRELVPVLKEADRSQERAAATLGANGFQIFSRITFPAIRWGFFYGLTLTFARALGEFGAALVIGGGIQGRTETATIYIFHAMEERQYIGAYSAAVLLGLFSLLMVLSSEFLKRRHE